MAALIRFVNFVEFARFHHYGKLPAEQLYADLLGNFPELAYLFTFAYDQGGHDFLISLQAVSDYGRICIWIIDTEELLFVADSFAQFWQRLRTELAE
ncbi:SMI1/KNR4 family protein [Paenibacillus campi]|uniref:SMI1/KNR4 family protein n=1 Tax=Paenibacillus campi TaxID=3106031 RepID=UPI002AFFA1EB|nr:SMI1/KNR4 family protein [Paenibacillus sp. SGZ-1009]